MRESDPRSIRIPFARIVRATVAQSGSARRQQLGIEPALEASYSAHGAMFQLPSLFMPRGVWYSGYEYLWRSAFERARLREQARACKLHT